MAGASLDTPPTPVASQGTQTVEDFPETGGEIVLDDADGKLDEAPLEEDACSQGEPSRQGANGPVVECEEEIGEPPEDSVVTPRLGPLATVECAASVRTSASLSSVGSVGHPLTCAPACKYVRKTRGCKDGAECSHCHFCVWHNSRSTHESGRKVGRRRKGASSAR